MTIALTGSLLAHLRVEHHRIDEAPTHWRARESALADESFVKLILSHGHALFGYKGHCGSYAISYSLTPLSSTIYPYMEYGLLPLCKLKIADLKHVFVAVDINDGLLGHGGLLLVGRSALSCSIIPERSP